MSNQNPKSAKEYIAGKIYARECYVIGNTKKMIFLDVNDKIVGNIEYARAFQYDEAIEHCKGFSELNVIKYAPFSQEIEEENEDADTDNSDFHRCSSEMNCDNDTALDLWKETRE